MAWTTPKTWTSALVTVAEFNTHIRDNLNWLKSPTGDTATLAAQITTTSTSFTDATGLSITMTTNGGNVLCVFTGCASLSTSGQIIFTIDVDGTDQGATDGLVSITENATSGNASFVYILEGLSAASHTIKIQWRVSTGTATLFADNSSANFKLEPTFRCVEIG